MESHKKPRRSQDLRVDRALHPDWITAAERLPARGEHVHTAEGTAKVVAIHGKTSMGGRLIEVAIDDGRKQPYFAAAANILVERDAPPQGAG